MKSARVSDGEKGFKIQKIEFNARDAIILVFTALVKMMLQC